MAAEEDADEQVDDDETDNDVGGDMLFIMSEFCTNLASFINP